jgi:opacity protein-like surface antigen
LVSFVPAEAAADEPQIAENGAVAIEPEPPPRPKPLEPLALHPPKATRHIDLGVGLSLLDRLTSGETTDGPTSVRYPAALGLSFSGRVDVFRHLRAGVYVMRHVADMELADGALGLPGNPGAASVASYSLGFRLAPTWPLSDRARLWVSAGVGWGRTEIGRFSVASPTGSFEVRERSSSHLEWPVGLGFSLDLIPNWLALELEVTGAVFTGERGDALRSGQAVDASGHVLRFSPFPAVEATFVQTLGLALLL